MASPISPGEVYAVAKFAFELFKACKASKGEFVQIGQEVFAMRTVIELTHIDIENPYSMLNITDNGSKSNRKALSVHIRNCEQALKDVEACLKRYSNMSGLDKLAWAWSGHDEVKGLESNLSSFATQLTGFTANLTLKGVSAVYQKQKRLQSGIGRIEIALENAGGNHNAAVQETMGDLDQSNMTPQCTERYKTIVSEYAREVSKSTSFTPPRAQTPNPRRRKDSTSTLGVPAANRCKSADTIRAAKDKGVSTGINMSVNKGMIRYTLECWLIQIKSGHLSLLTWEFLEKEIQPRGQWKLEEMAQQFRASKKSKLNNDHDLVNWVIKDRRKKEEEPKYTWYPYAAKKEEKGSLALNLGVEEQAMVIIKRRLTSEAQKEADELERLSQAKKRAVEKESAEKKAAKNKAAEKRAREAAAKKAKEGKEKQSKAEQTIAKKNEEISRLEQENARLKAQQKQAALIAAKKPKNDSSIISQNGTKHEKGNEAT